MLTLLVLISLAISSVYGAGCGGSTWKVSYSGDRCTYSGGQYKLVCKEKGNPSTCGMRLDSIPRLGQGTYSATIKAAPGEGLNTAFYLFSYGRYNDKSRPWNEIDIEILTKNPRRVWTNVWTGHGTQHGQFVNIGWDATKTFKTYTIKIDSTYIYWIFGGKEYRKWKYTGYSDLVQTINNLDFQGEISLWGANDNSWPDMGGMYNNNNNFPLYAYFKNVKLTKSSSGGSSGGGSSGGGSSGGSSSQKLKITNKNGLNKWWYAVVVSNIPSGISLTWVKMRGKGMSKWETGVKEWDYYKFTKNAPYSAPFDFKIKTSKGQTVTSYDIIKNLNSGTSAYMSKSVSSAFTLDLEDEETGNLHWTVIFAIIVLIGCFCCALIGGVWYLRKRKMGNVSFNDKEQELTTTTNKADTDTPATDDGDNNKTTTPDGYDMSPVTPQQEEVIEVEVETQA